MKDCEAFIAVGKISGVFGIKGWVRIFSFTEPRGNLLNYSPLYISRSNEWVKMNVSAGRIHGKGIVIELEGVIQPSQAMSLIDATLAITKQQLMPVATGEFYWADLIGLRVVNMQDDLLGIVDSLFENGAHDVLVVKDDNDKTEQLIPLVMDKFVDLIDLDNRLIRVDWRLDYLR